jgi:5'(3')-deoxyribonucleotidase
MEEKKKVVIDMDGTLVDFDKTFTKKLSKVLKTDLHKVDGRTYSLEETISRYANITIEEAKDVMSSIWNKKGFWKSLYPYEGAIEVTNELSEYCSVSICTRIPSGCPNAFIEKERWIIKHFPNIQIEFFAVSNGARKTRIKCDYIVEGRLKEIRFCPSGTVAILINRPWNTKESIEWSEDLEFIRVSSWKDILPIILKK